jgi:succinoglycan biosynthesis transport protein ExoP
MEKHPIELQGERLFDESVNLRQYWHIILERRWLVLAAFLLVFVVIGFYLFSATSIYSASTRLQIDQETENSLRVESFVLEGAREQNYLQTQYENLKSITLLNAVLEETLEHVLILDAINSGQRSIDKLAAELPIEKSELITRLNQIGKAGFLGINGFNEDMTLELFREEGRSLESGLFVFHNKKESKVNSREELLALISNSMLVKPIRLSRLVDIKFQSPNRNEAALIANTIVSKFLELENQRKEGKLANAISFLSEEVTSLGNLVHTNFMSLHSFKTKWDIISLEETQNTTLQALLKAQASYDEANSKVVQANASAEEAVRIFNETGQYAEIPAVSADGELVRLRSDLALAEADLASLSDRYLELHPKIIERRSSINVLKQSLKDAEKRIYNSIINNAQLARVTDERLAEVLTIRKAQQQSMNQKSIEYNNLERAATQSEAMYKLALQRLKETELQEKDIVQNMHVIDPATAPIWPVKPQKLIIMIVGFFASLGSGIGLAFFVNFLDDSIKSQEDIENYLKLSFLGYVPNIKTTSIIERDLQAHLHPQSNSAEAFRTVRAAISLSNRANDLQILAVTSTVPSEGKSLVASNHAIVTAQTGAKTLLVDCDLRRPSVHKAFQIQSPRGLTSFLLGREDSIDLISHQTEVPNLDIICCGAVPNNPSELAGSQRMLDFVAEVRTKYEKVVFDCPPVSAVSDPLIIASCADGTVFVNKFNKIRREHARKTVQRVQDAGINIIGVCINDLDFEGKDSYYYSYYYYQNRYYASHYKSDRSEKSDEKDSDIVVQPGVQRVDQSKKSA